jgi:DNA-binding beta-propeller fold protein YncE
MRFTRYSSLLVLAGSLAFGAEVRTLTEAQNPYGLTIGPDGALYICEIDAHKVTRLDLKTRQKTAIEAVFQQPYEIRFDKLRNLYVDDMPANQIYRLDAATKERTEIGGVLKQPHSIAFDRTGGLLICDIGNHRIRRVDLKTGAITTAAGTGTKDATPEGADLAAAPLNGPRAIAFDASGTMYIVLREGNAIFRVDPSTNRIYRFAGTGEKGYTGDGGPALEAKLNGPKGIACAPDGSVYFADTENHAIRRIDSKGLVTTVLGTGVRGDGPDGDPLHCKLSRPHGIFVGSDGTVYVGDSESNKVRILR